MTCEANREFDQLVQTSSRAIQSFTWVHCIKLQMSALYIWIARCSQTAAFSNPIYSAPRESGASMWTTTNGTRTHHSFWSEHWLQLLERPLQAMHEFFQYRDHPPCLAQLNSFIRCRRQLQPEIGVRQTETTLQVYIYLGTSLHQ